MNRWRFYLAWFFHGSMLLCAICFLLWEWSAVLLEPSFGNRFSELIVFAFPWFFDFLDDMVRKGELSWSLKKLFWWRIGVNLALVVLLLVSAYIYHDIFIYFLALLLSLMMVTKAYQYRKKESRI